jgi:hypothetical protein
MRHLIDSIISQSKYIYLRFNFVSALKEVISENCELNLLHLRNVTNINNKNKNALEIHTDSPTAQVTVQMFLLLYL